MNRTIIFTDLDGTLLNHEDYSYKDAKSALDKLKKKGIPIVITTSKTRKEVEILRREMGIKDPFIVENGGGIFFEKSYRNFRIENCKYVENYCLVQLGISYKEIIEFEKKVKDKYRLKGFFFMNIKEISRLTGLSYEMAKLAKEREFTEPFIIEDESKIPALEREALKYGIKITKGGRFYHFIGINQDKGKAVLITKEIFERNEGGKFLTVGLGDSKNDIPMLEVVDIPILIMKPDGSFENFEKKGLIRSKYPGSKGWNQVIMEILDEIQRDFN